MRIRKGLSEGVPARRISKGKGCEAGGDGVFQECVWNGVGWWRAKAAKSERAR